MRAEQLVEVVFPVHKAYRDGKERDLARTECLQTKGVRVLRFTNLEVLQNRNSIAETTLQAIVQPSP